jgi:HAE1 family hydrophobic/amphiphilic exporter-1
MKRRAPRRAAAAFLAAAGVAVSGTSAADPLSRAEAVARALEVNPQVRRSLEDLARLDGLIREAKADALPEVTLVGTAARFRDPSLLNSPNFEAFPPEFGDVFQPIPTSLYEGMVTLRQTLFSFKVGAAIRAARLGRAFGQEELARARQAVSLAAVQAYNQYLLGLERVRIAEKSVRLKRTQLEMARNRRLAGVATDLEVLRFEVDLENDRARLLAVRGQADLARGNLNAVLVRPIDAPIEPTDSLELVPTEVSIDEAVREAWANRPEARAIALLERIQDQLVTVAAGDGRPSLELTAAYGSSVREPDNFFRGDFAKWSAGVSLRVPVFDGFRTAGKVAQARAERDKVAQDRIALENQIRLEAKDAVDRLDVARKVLEAADLNVAQAQKAFDMTQANYRLGAASTLDVMDAQAALTQAESNRIEALFAHASARAALRYVMALSPLDPPRPRERRLEKGGEP